ncbi:MAG TPA: carboxypeptidase regulatory-like domain-containing protein [Gemmatimonadaceae bacterium]|nr:carboxypeptidase regulatory-like domain-containing protein [Gemmatimonadaceae bacterium]
MTSHARRNLADSVATVSLVVAAMLVALQPALLRGLLAQSMTTASINGSVSVGSGSDAEGAEVQVINRATGVVTRGRVHLGRFSVHGLEVGGPYTLVVRRLGAREHVRDGLYLTLGQDLRIDVTLEPIAVTLQPTIVESFRASSLADTHAGLSSTVSDSLLRRLPTANRDLYEFVALDPLVSTRNGISGGGVNFRFNSYLIDGAAEMAINGGNPAGVASGGRSISIEAVKEYQVLLSPYDVWNGNFAGALINAVTRSGTNRFSGSVFTYFRNERLARDVPYLRAAPYDQIQYGASLGGPVVRDRVHFFLTFDLQGRSVPASGPYIGQSAVSSTPLPVDAGDVGRFIRILNEYGVDAGTAGAVSNRNPVANLFGRVDVALPMWNSRLVMRHNHGSAADHRFSRPIVGRTFPLSSYGSYQESGKDATVMQLYSNLHGGAFNELIAARVSAPVATAPEVRAPLIYVTVPGAGGMCCAFLQAGSVETAQGNMLQQESYELTDNLTFSPGVRHRLTLGLTTQFQRVRREGVSGSYGIWGFSSLDSLKAALPDSFRVTKDFGGGDATLRDVTFAAYVGDRWQVSDRFNISLGLRGDVSVVRNRPPYSPDVDFVFGRRTDDIPSGMLQWSPRVGFTYELTSDHQTRLRGGAGVFAGRPPLGWWLNAFINYGAGIGTLRCGTRSTDGPAPAFTPDYRHPPESCANGRGFRTNIVGPLNLLGKRLRYPETRRASLALDRQLPWDVVATAEAIYTQNHNDFLFINRNLKGSVGVDRRGRVLYGKIDSTGLATPDLVSRYPVAIDLQNQSRNYSYAVAVQLQKRFSGRFEAQAAYTYTRVFDVQTQLSPVAFDNWRVGRPVSGNKDALDVGISDYDQPHRFLFAATWAFPWRWGTTDVSAYYVGASGAPFTYTASDDSRKGDLNADGSNANDPIYVPRSVFDTAEIQFRGTPAEVRTQQLGLDSLINGNSCLFRQRGRIMERNSCSSPWVHTMNVSVRQSLPRLGGRALSIELQVFNFLNLLNDRWGRVAKASAALFKQVGQTTGVATQSQPIFLFDPTVPRFNASNPESNYQLQLAMRVTF